MLPRLTEFPAWIEELPAKEQGLAKAKFMLKYAAVLSTPEGTILALSRKMGFSNNGLSTIAARATDGRLTLRTIKGIEALIGTGTIPREMMDPETYGE